MTEQALAAAIQRAQKVLQRRPALAIHDDSPATAEWRGGTRVASRHANGTQILSDMPAEVGGSGDQVTPGWLLRAGLAACATTRIAMGAATAGIELSALEVTATSRSDTRGLLGMTGTGGEPIGAGPMDVELYVRIAAPGAATELLRALVEASCRRSPVPVALQNAIPVALRIEVGFA